MSRPEFARDFGGAFFVAKQNDFRLRMQEFPTLDGITLNDADVSAKRLRCGKKSNHRQFSRFSVNRSGPFEPDGRECVRPRSFPLVISRNTLAQEFFLFKSDEREREPYLELGIVTEESLKQHRLRPKYRPFTLKNPSLRRERSVIGKRDVVNVHDDALVQPRQDLEVEIGNI